MRCLISDTSGLPFLMNWCFFNPQPVWQTGADWICSGRSSSWGSICRNQRQVYIDQCITNFTNHDVRNEYWVAEKCLNPVFESNSDHFKARWHVLDVIWIYHISSSSQWAVLNIYVVQKLIICTLHKYTEVLLKWHFRCLQMKCCSD